MKKILFLSTLFFLVVSCSKEETINNDVINSNKEKEEISMTNRCIDKSRINSYSDGISNLGYQSSKIYYPTVTESTKGKLPIVIVMHGWLGSKEKMDWVGKLIAENGFASIVITASNHKNVFTNPRHWVKNYDAAFKSIIAENKRKESPLYNRLQLDNISIVGHSMGAGGSLFFAEKTNFKIKSIVALAPYALGIKKPGKKVNVPTRIIAGGKDFLAVGLMTKNIYKTIKSASKDYVFYDKVGHNDFERDGKYHSEIGSDIVSWLLKYGK